MFSSLYFDIFKHSSWLFFHFSIVGLPDASIDVVIASQSFHWFANATALEEIHRVLVPQGMFGIIWAIPDISVPWLGKVWKFLTPLYKEQSIILPYDEKWKRVFSLTPRKLFSDLEENLSFGFTLPSSSDGGYKVLASASVIAGGTESTKESFREFFSQVMEEDFEGKGINLDHHDVPFQIYISWCNKLV